MTCDAAGHCESKPFACGTAHDIVTVPAKLGQTYIAGQEIDVWIDQSGAVFDIPACLTSDW